MGTSFRYSHDLIIHKITEHIHKYAYKHDAYANNKQPQGAIVKGRILLVCPAHFQHSVQNHDQVDRSNQQANADKKSAGVI